MVTDINFDQASTNLWAKIKAVILKTKIAWKWGKVSYSIRRVYIWATSQENLSSGVATR